MSDPRNHDTLPQSTAGFQHKAFQPQKPKQSSWVRNPAPSLDNRKHTRCLKDNDRRPANRRASAAAGSNTMDAFQKSGFCMPYYVNSIGRVGSKILAEMERVHVYVLAHICTLTYKHKYCRGCKSVPARHIGWPTNETMQTLGICVIKRLHLQVWYDNSRSIKDFFVCEVCSFASHRNIQYSVLPTPLIQYVYCSLKGELLWAKPTWEKMGFHCTQIKSQIFCQIYTFLRNSTAIRSLNEWK